MGAGRAILALRSENIVGRLGSHLLCCDGSAFSSVLAHTVELRHGRLRTHRVCTKAPTAAGARALFMTNWEIIAGWPAATAETRLEECDPVMTSGMFPEERAGKGE